jgi:PKD repeat protein
VTLSASPSGGNGTFDYSWQFIALPTGTTATLSNPIAPSPTFTPDKAGNYVVELIVQSAGLNSAAATVTVIVHDSPIVRSIVATPNPAIIGQTVELSASPRGGTGAYTYAWTLTPPPGSAAVLTDPSDPSPTFTADLSGSYGVALTVTDENGVASPTVFLTVNAAVVP